MKNDYTFVSQYNNKNLEELWANISIDLREKNIREITSIRGIIYKIEEVTNVTVTYSAPSRNVGKEEEISKIDIINFLEVLKKHKSFNTASIKLDLPTQIYAKRSALFALLLALNIITKTN